MSAHARKALEQRQRNREIQKLLTSNQQSFIQMDSREFIEYTINIKKQSGMKHADAVDWISSTLSANSVQSAMWEQSKEEIKLGTGLIPLWMDYQALTVLAMEMKKGGNTFSKFKITNFHGKPHIILQGYSGLRKHLTGTRYLLSNPKIVSMGIGKIGALNSIKTGTIVSIIISASFHSIEQLLNDKATWHDFVGGLSTDIAITAVSSGIAWATVATVVGGTTAMVAIGPMVAVVVVGSLLAITANSLIPTDQIADSIAAGLRKGEENFHNNMKDIRNEINKAQRWYNQDPIGFMHRLFGIPNVGTYR